MSRIQNDNNMGFVDVLWTGGWDSTFRILQLSTKNIIIQPHYIKDNRKSENLELNSIRSITEDIRNLASTKCTLRDLITLDVAEIDEDEKISCAYKNLAKNYSLGSQYDWLARYSKKVNGIEIGDENGSAKDSIIYGAIRANGDVKRMMDDIKGEYYVIDKSISSEDIIKTFGNYHYPILFYTKLEMKKEAEERGFGDIMDKTWFCHTPINEQACGVCFPCMFTIKKGLGYRLNKTALMRYRRYKRKKFFEPIKNTLIYRSLKKIWREIKAKKIEPASKSYDADRYQ